MSPKSPASLANTIRRHRERAGLSQGALAGQIGMQRSTLMRLERGEIAAPDPEKLEALAKALEIDPEELFAKYPAPEKLPEMTPYLRAKYGMSDEAVAEAERFFNELSDREQSKRKGSRGKRTR